MSKITIQQIAKLAGVNKATVSRVLNKSASISEKTRLKIETIMKENNYIPNSIARGLAFNKTFTVGFCFDYTDKQAFSNPFFYKVLQGVEEVIYDNDYLFLMMSDHDKKNEKSTFERIVTEHRVDGIIMPNSLLNEMNYNLLISHNMPFVVIGENILVKEGIRWVDVDNTHAAQILTEKLISLGHRNIVIFAEAAAIQRDKFIVDRLEGYKKAIQQHGMIPRIIDGQDQLNDQLLPDAVICCSHEQLFEILEWERDNPDLAEIGLATFDDSPMFRHMRHPVHFVEIDLEMMGKQSAELLFKLINNEVNVPESIRIPTILIN